MKLLKSSVKPFLAIVVLLSTLNLSAQKNDFQTWTTIELKKKVTKKLSFELEEELRLCNNSTTFGQNNLTLSSTYALHKKLRLGLGYRYAYENEFDDGHSKSHRIMVNATLRHKMQTGILLTFRERFQTDFSMGNRSKMFLRHRLQAAYKNSEFDWSPYLNVELTQALNNPVKNTIEKVRVFAGCEYDISYRLSANLAFGFQHSDRPLKKPKNYYMLNIGLSYLL